MYDSAGKKVWSTKLINDPDPLKARFVGTHIPSQCKMGSRDNQPINKLKQMIRKLMAEDRGPQPGAWIYYQLNILEIGYCNSMDKC